MQLVSFGILVITSYYGTLSFFGGCGFFKFADVLPNKASFYMKGENITLTCIINPSCYTGTVNASSLGFRINSTNFLPEHPYVSFINKTTTQLTVPDSNFSSGGMYQCVQFTNGENIKAIFGIVADTVRIAMPPPTVNNNSFDCSVYNWVYMNCSFDPGHQTNLVTTYNLTYATGSDTLYECPNYDSVSHSCKWSKQQEVSDFFESQIYFLKVTVVNFLGTTESLPAVIDPLVLVKPAPVTNIKIHLLANRSTSVMVAFNVDEYTKLQIFKVFYKSNFDDMWQYIEVVKAEKRVNVTINGLIPFAKYSYKIKAIPSICTMHSHNISVNPSICGKSIGSWSELAVADGPFQQDSDVPWAAPVFAPGSFQRSDCKNNCPSFCGDNCAKVTIFWPKVEERYRNGNIAGYKIEGGPETENIEPTAGISMSKTMDLDNNKNYKIFLSAATDKGYSPNRSTIYIPRKAEAPAAPAYVAAIALNSSTALVKWQQTEGNDQELPTTYTVFWCIGKVQCIYKRFSDLYSEIVPADVKRSVYINTAAGDPVEYWFSVSANNEHGHSSGMISSECVYRPNNGLSPPELRKSLLEEDNIIAVDWSTIQCDKKNDIIVYYEIWFCEVQPDNNDICQTGTEKHEMANGNETQHIISKDIKADSQYLVWAVSVTDSGKSRESKKIKVVSSGYSGWEIALIAVAAVIGLTFVCCGIFFVFRKWGTEIHQFCTKDYPMIMPPKDQELGHINYNNKDYYHPLSGDSSQTTSGVQRKHENEKNLQKLENEKGSQRDSLIDSGKGDSTLPDFSKARAGASDTKERAPEDYSKFAVNNGPNRNNSNGTVLNKEQIPSQRVTIRVAMASTEPSYEGDDYRKGIPVTNFVDSSADTEDDGYRSARIQSDPKNTDKGEERELLDSENDDSGSHDLYNLPGEKDDSYKKCKLKESDNIAEEDETNIDSSDISSSGSIPYKGFTLKNAINSDNMVKENDISDSSIPYRTVIQLNGNTNHDNNNEKA